MIEQKAGQFFLGKLQFLSNFYPSPIEIKLSDDTRAKCPTVEHAYQALKSLDASQQRLVISSKTAIVAKRMGSAVKLRPDWELVKMRYMAELVRRKFQSKELMNSLKNTAGPLVEYNDWHDNYWGYCVCAFCESEIHKNELGKILMTLRDN